MMPRRIHRAAVVIPGEPQSKDFKVYNSAPAGYSISVRIWKNKPPVSSWGSASEKSDVGAAQGVAFDGTHYYVTSRYPVNVSSNSNLVKWDSSWNYVTHRDCLSDGPVDAGQVNGVYYHPIDGMLYVGAPSWPTEPYEDYIYVYDPADLSFVTSHRVGDAVTEGCTWWNNSWWVCYGDFTSHFIDQYDASWVFVARHDLPEPAPAIMATDGGANGIIVVGDIFYVNIHGNQSTFNHESTRAYIFYAGSFHFVGQIAQPFTYAGQSMYYHAATDKIHWALRTSGSASAPQNVGTNTPLYVKQELYCDGLCRDDFADIRITNEAGDKTLCGAGTGWLEHKQDGLFAWVHFTLQDAIVAEETFKLTYGVETSWQDDRNSTLNVYDDFEDETRGNFTLDYNTSTATSSTDDAVEGSRSLKTVSAAGGSYCPADTYTAQDLFRTGGYIRRNPGRQDIYPICPKSGDRGQIGFHNVSATAFDSDVEYDLLTDMGFTPQPVLDWARFEFEYNSLANRYHCFIWTAGGAGKKAKALSFTPGAYGAAYADLLVYGDNYTDLVFGKDLVWPAPVIGEDDYQGAPLGDIGQWEMDSGSGTVLVDSSPVANNGAGVNTDDTNWAIPGANGGGFCFQLNGSPEAINIPYVPAYDQSSFSFCIWVKTLTLIDDYIALAGRDDAGKSSWALVISDVGQGRKARFYVYSGGWVSIESTSVFSDNSPWIHFAVTHQTSERKLYINGVLEDSSSASNSIQATTANLAIGNRGDQTGRWLNGYVDDARMYSRVLTPEEIAALAQAGV